jgi:putative acid phosphatase of HAD superfamily subfamily IIIB
VSYNTAPVWLGYSGTILQGPKKKPAVIVDLDQSLINNEHRQHFMQGDTKRWASFFDAMRDDTVYPEVKLIVDLIFRHTEIAVLLVTGRPSHLHGVTLQNLHDLEINFTALIMRAQNDNRADAEVKLDMLEGIKSMGFDPLFVIDDRPEVVHMWRSQGIRCLQCDPKGWETEDPGEMNRRMLLDENQRLRARVAALEVANAVTNFGITQGMYDRWRRSRSLAERSVTHLTPEEKDLIYAEAESRITRA